MSAEAFRSPLNRYYPLWLGEHFGAATETLPSEKARNRYRRLPARAIDPQSAFAKANHLREQKKRRMFIFNWNIRRQGSLRKV